MPAHIDTMSHTRIDTGVLLGYTHAAGVLLGYTHVAKPSIGHSINTATHMCIFVRKKNITLREKFFLPARYLSLAQRAFLLTPEVNGI